MRYWTEKAEHGGYEKCSGTIQREDGKWINTGQIEIHRLCAIAWYGTASITNRDVHHRIPIPWLNVESNLLSLPQPEHGIIEGDVAVNGHRDTVTKAVTEAFGDG